jgi:CheY-like chemotaxis protein
MSRPILVVEDDTGIREMLVECLTDAGYPVVEASNGQSALALLRGGLAPALILLDLIMPLMNGQEFLSSLRAEPAVFTAPVVILTADQREQAHAARLGVAAVVPKPMDLDILLSIVEGYAAPGPGEVVEQPHTLVKQPAGSC